MRHDEYDAHDATGLADLVRRGDITPDELLDIALARIEAVDAHGGGVGGVGGVGGFGSMADVREEHARRAIADGLPDGPLRGVPFVLKDLGCEAVGLPTSSGSRLFHELDPGHDSELYVRLRATGLVTFGRTTSPELGIGPTTEAKVYGHPTRNPWHLDHVAGGSSGGSGAAVAAGIVPIAHGSDGGGSIRIPASSCGVFGLKPTRARLPDGPVAGEGWAGMAVDGFLTRSVRDTAALLDATHGPDVGAPYTAPHFDGSYLGQLDEPLAPLRIAVLDHSFTGDAIHPECVTAVQAAAHRCEALGHHVVVTAPSFDLVALMAAWSDIVACGTMLAVESVERHRGRPAERDELESVTLAAIAHARSVSGAAYLTAVEHVHGVGRRIGQWYEANGIDVLLSPVLAEPPARIGRFRADRTDIIDFLEYRLERVLPYSPFAPLANATGQPSMSVPLHWTAEGLPVGLQFTGRFGDEGRLLQLAVQLEEAMPWFRRRPVLSAGPVAT